MNLKRVTVTGADDSVRPQDLSEITVQYPYVEWAILMSASSEGHPRFPTADWINRFQLEMEPASRSKHKIDVQTSGHLCGKWVRDFCKGIPTYLDECRWKPFQFNRYQLNFHAITHTVNMPKFRELTELFTRQQFIFQMDVVNEDILPVAISQGIDAVPLFDTSGGIGRLPDEWPKQEVPYSGYAGGLSPENVADELGKISKVATGDIWIDAETRLRSDDDSVLDLGKVVAFLEAAKPWVTNG